MAFEAPAIVEQARSAGQSFIQEQDLIFIPQDKEILRRLAGEVAELSTWPIEDEKRRRWKDHNTIHRDPRRVIRWVEIVRQEAEALD